MATHSLGNLAVRMCSIQYAVYGLPRKKSFSRRIEKKYLYSVVQSAARLLSIAALSNLKKG